jgi:predicted N-acetyltransferase YhbS
MIVEPGRQRSGLGRTVARAVIDWAHGRGCTTIRLIATPAGTPLYRQLGFVPDGESLELKGIPRPSSPGSGRSSVRPWRAQDTDEVARFDAPAFGTDRSRLLSAYAREFSTSAWVARDDSGAVSGFLVVQDESLGPWCAAGELVAGQLLDVALAGVTRPLKAGVVDDVGARLLSARGLARIRPLPRMRLGPPVPHAPSPHLLAHASYAVG